MDLNKKFCEMLEKLSSNTPRKKYRLENPSYRLLACSEILFHCIAEQGSSLYLDEVLWKLPDWDKCLIDYELCDLSIKIDRINRGLAGPDSIEKNKKAVLSQLLPEKLQEKYMKELGVWKGSDLGQGYQRWMEEPVPIFVNQLITSGIDHLLFEEVNKNDPIELQEKMVQSYSGLE